MCTHVHEALLTSTPLERGRLLEGAEGEARRLTLRRRDVYRLWPVDDTSLLGHIHLTFSPIMLHCFIECAPRPHQVCFASSSDVLRLFTICFASLLGLLRLLIRCASLLHRVCFTSSLDVLRFFIRCASLLHQGCFRSSSGMVQIFIRDASDLHQGCFTCSLGALHCCLAYEQTMKFISLRSDVRMSKE